MAQNLPCVICAEPQSLDDIGIKWSIATGVCYACYEAGRKLPDDEWCFASPEAYDEKDETCRDLCPDRKICRRVIAGQLVLPQLPLGTRSGGVNHESTES